MDRRTTSGRRKARHTVRRRPAQLLRNRWVLLVTWVASLYSWSGRHGGRDPCARGSDSSTDAEGGWATTAPSRGGTSIFACAASEETYVEGTRPLNDTVLEAYMQPHVRRGDAAATDTAPAHEKQRIGDVAAAGHGSRPSSVLQLILAAGRQGVGGGVSGALAGMVQVVTLMWLRTLITYQCRYGTSFRQALQTLLRDGGIARLYRGLGFALVQAPLCRFVSTAANDGVNALLSTLSATENWGTGKKVAVASLVVGVFRMILMPIDTMKTVLQVDSVDGFQNLLQRVKRGRIGLLYQGTFATYLSSVLGHFPWYWTYNILESSGGLARLLRWRLARSATIGFLASVVSDTVINSVRVVKTIKQSLGSKRTVSYGDAVRLVLATDGWRGLLGRGLGPRILGNAVQSIVFTVIWRSLAETGAKQDDAAAESGHVERNARVVTE